MTKTKNKIESRRKRKKTILGKKMRFVFFFQTSNLYLMKQKYKSFLKLFSLQNILEKLESFLKRKQKQNK
jgi:hypothetical protein